MSGQSLPWRRIPPGPEASHEFRHLDVDFSIEGDRKKVAMTGGSTHALSDLLSREPFNVGDFDSRSCHRRLLGSTIGPRKNVGRKPNRINHLYANRLRRAITLAVTVSSSVGNRAGAALRIMTHSYWCSAKSKLAKSKFFPRSGRTADTIRSAAVSSRRC